ncbi:HAD family hydrolase [Brooklawnia propionicigenes]|uniref:HAD family hydrolase n=1 Tax=Brooklawnia propionicigenes TaxID=3041175 RepID=UPI002573B78B|nr:HAD family hydrolase [Brooklawnia sp. SH051]
MKAVSFDIGNTLLQGGPGGGYCSHFARCVDRPFDCLRPIFRQYFLTTRTDLAAATRAACGAIGHADADAIIDSYRPQPARVFPDALPCLEWLKTRGFRMFGLSNCTPWEAGGLVETGLAAFLEDVIYSFDAGAIKPEQPIFQRAIEQVGIPTAEVTHVGDSLGADIHGAISVGWKAVLLDRGRSSEHPGLPPAVPVISTLDDLPDSLT